MHYPLIKEILYQDPLLIFSKFAKEPQVLLLDSAQLMEGCGRYSFIGVDPFFTLQSKKSSRDPFHILADKLNSFPMSSYPDLPPFQGGIAGFFSYDLCHHLENIAAPKSDDMQFPDMSLGFYDLVIGFDHVLQRAWIFSSGFPLTKQNDREIRAKKRCEWLLKKMEEKSYVMTKSHPYCRERDIEANFTPKGYQTAVQKVKNYILDGDIFEANISQRFKAIVLDDLDHFDLYLRLRKINPAPFSAYLNLGDTVLASASPERFLKLNNRNVETRPIKGTRPRGKTDIEDLQNANELKASEKDHAENVMIVDLLRNDLSRVCLDHSVQVPQLCGLESYASVHHLVSVVTGTLQSNYQAIDLLKAAFPGGSITGAPKIRAMEIIAEIEPTQRGPYCGSVGYIGFDGTMDTSIIIRTYAIKKNIVTFQAGGAIVLDSDPLGEYEETLTKANALKRALVE